MNKIIILFLMMPLSAALYANDELNKHSDTNPHRRITQFLINLTDQETRNLKYINDPQDTHLKKSSFAIKTKFGYNEIPGIDKENIIGFAPMGTYEDGWSGVVEFFKDKALGTCGYYNDHIDYVSMNKKYVTYEVNHRPTIQSFVGNAADGYLATISWHAVVKENERFGVSAKDVKCASYQPIDKKALIALANKIESTN